MYAIANAMRAYAAERSVTVEQLITAFLRFSVEPENEPNNYHDEKAMPVIDASTDKIAFGPATKRKLIYTVNK